MELEQYHAIDPRTGWWHQTYRWVTKKENKMINELKDGDRAEVVREFACMSIIRDIANLHVTGWVERSSTGAFIFKTPNRSYFFYKDGQYDLSPCLRKITDTKELTVEQISKELGYDVKVVKG